MKTIPLLIFFFLQLSLPLKAASIFNYLIDGVPDTAYENIKTYSYNRGLSFSKNFAEPGELRVMNDWTVHNTHGENPSGSPQKIHLIDDDFDDFYVNIREGETGGWSKGKQKGKRLRVELLNEQGEPATGNPVYFHITAFDGTQYRIHATRTAEHCLGHPVFKITPDGTQHLFIDSGFEIVLDEQGFIVQWKDLHEILFVTYPEENSRIIENYPVRQIEKAKVNGRYVLNGDDKPPRARFELTYPAPDERSYMKLNSFTDGTWAYEIVWVQSKNPFLYRKTTKVANQEKIYRDKHYYDDENGDGKYELNSYRQKGEYQYNYKSIYDQKDWHVLYSRKVKDGHEVIDKYHYVRFPETKRGTRYHTIHQPAEGKWFRKEYDDEGRITLEWTPIEEVVKEEFADDTIQELISLFPDASEENVKKHQEIRLTPEKVPEDLTLAETSGVVEYFGYEPLSPDDKVSDEDTRPRFLFKLEQGKLIHRKWRIYGTRENGNAYFLEEESDDPKAAFGNEKNRQTLTEYFGKNHATAPGKKSSVSHADGSMEVYYYDLGTWNPERKNFEVNPEGKELRTEITHGKLIDSVWDHGTTSITIIQEANEKILLKRTRELQSDGTWKTLKES